MRTLALALLITGLSTGSAVMAGQAQPVVPAPASGAIVTAPEAAAAGPDAAIAAPDKADPSFAKDDVLGAAEAVFGKGAKGLAEIIERSLKQYGEPNAYITGREVGGAFIVGVRYGSGTLHHKIEGERQVH